MTSTEAFALHAVGTVQSTLVDIGAAPRQHGEGAPPATLVFEPRLSPALEGLRPGDRVIVLTWLDQADRSVLRVHPRDDPGNPQQGVFSTHSSHRPNPIGLHEVQVLAVDGRHVRVAALEAVDGTPIVDLKPVLGTPPSGGAVAGP